MDKTHLVICNCGSCEHQLIFGYFEEDEPKWDYMYCDVHLTTYKNFFQRLIAGVRYIFGYRSRYGEFDEVMLDKGSAAGLATFLSEWRQDDDTST